MTQEHCTLGKGSEGGCSETVALVGLKSIAELIGIQSVDEQFGGA